MTSQKVYTGSATSTEKEYESFESFATAIEEYIDYYDNKRIQVKTKWMPPVKYRETSMCCCA
ncbi:MAG: IS3 family transposase [Lachnospiraceae bacterium]|nr:IS3 family transposase [Lachnospiraceae bacterium]